MSTQKHHHTFAVVILLGVVLLFALLVFSFYKAGSSENIYSPNNSLAENNTYTSEVLGVSFFVPDGFEMDENYTNIILSNTGRSIMINRVSTNLDTIEEYVDYIQRMNNFTLNEKETTEVGEYLGISGNVDDERIIYVSPSKGIVYSISTTSPELYDELDQVAQSFRYTGDTSSE